MTSLVGDLVNSVQLDRTTLYLSAASIAFNPLAWNIVARSEYNHKVLTRLFKGDSKSANYGLAVFIFTIGMFRDWLFTTAIKEQPSHPWFTTPYSQIAGWALLTWGTILVVTSTARLGIRATFLGDYFGYLLDDIVTGFPFNVSGAPMYWGATLNFLGLTFLYGKPAGILLTAWVYFVYIVALSFEDPFTAAIYAKRDRERAAANSGSNGVKKNN